MNKRPVYFAVFIIMVLAQWIVPANMILSRNEILSSGKLFRFVTVPVDPNDPFRGKYVALDFENNFLEVLPHSNLNPGDQVYVTLEQDGEGFASLKSYMPEKPDSNEDYLQVIVRDIIEQDGDNRMVINYPFDRFYMEESQAQRAEKVYLESLNANTTRSWAEVYIYMGDAVLSDVVINGRSLKDL